MLLGALAEHLLTIAKARYQMAEQAAVPGMKKLPTAAMAVVFFIAVALSAAAVCDAAVVEHTFVVSQMNVRHMCKDTLVTVVNEQFPGPVIEITEGDSVVVHVINMSPYGITIHWHGIKQTLNCWADGVGMITQCPILPNNNFTYRFDVTGQEGTLWWHAHVTFLRATMHGVFIIRPKFGSNSYPFPKPDKDIPIIIGDWWEMQLPQVDQDFLNGHLFDFPRASTINGKLGDYYNCSGVAEDKYIMNVEFGKTYLLRIVNAVLFSEYYFKIAGHRFTVVAVDASYIKPYTTDMIVIAPGETMDVLMVTDAPPSMYYMVAMANQPPEPDTQIPKYVSRGILQYNCIHTLSYRHSPNDIPMPKMPDQHDVIKSFYFHRNITSLPHPQLPPVPVHVDEHLFVTLGLGSICKGRHKSSCKRGGSNETILVATMNNISFHLPTAPLLEAHYYNKTIGVHMQELPSRPPKIFNFTDEAMIPYGPPEERFEPTSKATIMRRFRYNMTVEVVFQNTAVMQIDSNPMHLHGHNFFVIAQGLGNYNAEKDVKKYNLVDPPLRNTVYVPGGGWAVIRFVANNPGVWYMHCHFEFHVVMGMAAAFVVDNGPTLDTTLPPPPADLPKCAHNNLLEYE